MNDSKMSKQMRNEIHSLAIKAHEEELRRALFILSEKFDQWKIGSRTSIDLTEDIHTFHSRDARNIFNRYEPSFEEMSVAMAIATGILNSESIPTDVREVLKLEIENFKEKNE